VDTEAIIAQIRDRYVDQFKHFAAKQQGQCTRGAAEVKFQLDKSSGFFDAFYCADFVRNDNDPQVVELAPDTAPTFDPISEQRETLQLTLKPFTWDNAHIEHDAAEIAAYELSEWFHRWFDPADERHVANAQISDVIHNATVQRTSVAVDFGTAQPAALWDLIEILKRAGARSVIVGPQT